jgi:class 3 adenylate cyclase
MNAFHVAEDVGVSRLEATRALLFATRLGVTDLTWDVHCPMCLAVPQFHRHLMELPERAHCELCKVRWDVSIEDQLEATFTLNANVRDIDGRQFTEAVWPRDKAIVFRRLARDGRQPVLGLKLVEGAAVENAAVFAAGEYHYSLPGDDEGSGRLVVSGEPVTAEQLVSLRVTAERHFDVRTLELRPGPARFRVHSDLRQPDWGMHVVPVAAPHHWVSATYITSLQDFRDLFAGEFLAADRSFAIRNLTLLFTDITGSTEMYERLGDARAYALVQQHFELMTAVIRRREGGIVKTIGDAVMASFPLNADSVKAALEIQKGFAEVSEPLRQITVKIGMHRGPVIAVTSNRMLDYFGRTVNVAARVQGASQSGEVLATDAVLSDPVVKKWLDSAGIGSERRTVQMKGIAGSVPVFSLRAPGPVALPMGTTPSF